MPEAGVWCTSTRHDDGIVIVYVDGGGVECDVTAGVAQLTD